MQRKTWAGLAIGTAAIVVAALVLRVALWQPFPLTGSAPQDGFTRVPGVIHVHTTRSDGGGTTQEVLAAARATGLSFVVVTDHNQVGAPALARYHDGVLAISGTEISTNAGHLLALGIADPGYAFPAEVHDALDDIRRLGGIPVAAHPWSPRADLQWTGWRLPGPWGVELVNLDSAWRRAGWMRLGWAMLAYRLNPSHALLSVLDTPGQRLAAWDGLLAQRDTAGFAGSDAHSRIDLTDALHVRFPSYASLFALVKTHVVLGAPLTGDAGRDTSTILDALRRGASYVAVDGLAPAGGFSFTLESAEGRHTMGETVPVDTAGPGGSMRLVAGGRLPAGTRLTLLRDGHAIAERAGSITIPVPGPGSYRVEARLPGWTVPWILSNPIYVHDEPTRQRRVARAAWPSDAQAPRARDTIETFDGDTTFTAGADPSSQAVVDVVVDPRNGHDGPASARLRFRLGAGPNASCELATRQARNLTGRTGLVFSIRSDAPYRIWVQVRDLNPALAEHTETWAASVRTSDTWRRVAIPFSALRSDAPETDGRLDLDQVRALAFLIDRGAVRPGTSGTIWIDDVGLY